MIRAALACLLLSGCFGSVISKAPPPSSAVCPAVSMAECDTSDPATPATAAEISADFALDLAAFYKAQRTECAKLNSAKAGCLRPDSDKKGFIRRMAEKVKGL